jgi:cyclic pyranopterin monophosphate synthase
MMRVLWNSLPFLSTSSSSLSLLPPTGTTTATTAAAIKRFNGYCCSYSTNFGNSIRIRQHQQRYDPTTVLAPISSSKVLFSSSSSSSSTDAHQLYIEQINELEQEQQALFAASSTGINNNSSKNNKNVSNTNTTTSNEFLSFVSQQEQDLTQQFSSSNECTIEDNANDIANERETLVYGFTNEERHAWSTNATIASNASTANSIQALLREIELARQQQDHQNNEQQQSNNRIGIEVLQDRQQSLTLSTEKSNGTSTTSTLSSESSPSQQQNQQFTHLSDDQKQIRMVDVGDKAMSKRTAIAQAMMTFPPEVIRAFTTTIAATSNTTTKKIDEWMGPKGPIFATAITAGIMGVKQTSQLIPLCHPLPIEYVHIDIEWYNTNTIQITCTTSITHKTGVEMEAMMGCSITALTIYDMVKAISHNVQITNIQLLYKDGGKRHVDER